jgi:glycosyltransferase involved in cell wall biosynthesis
MSFLRPVRLAVYFDQKIQTGGGYQQALNAALLVKKLPESLVTPVFYIKHRESVEALEALGVVSILLEPSFLSRVATRIRGKIKSESLLQWIKKIFGPNGFEKYFLRDKIDLVYFLSPSAEAVNLEELNYVMTIWDLCFRENVEFPEIRSDRAFENRDLLFREILPKASAILADSEMGKKNLSKYYGIDYERIYVLPFMPAHGVMAYANLQEEIHLDIPSEYALDIPYIFYPAQFWAHKNHAYILYGLKVLESRYGYKVGAIFSGENKGNLKHIKKLAQELGLVGRIRFAGFVEDSLMPYLYKQSLALVMPTYFGPTNLPPYEAFSLGIPVMYSDRPGLREQVGDAALLMDLTNPDSMAKNLVNLIENEEVASRLIQNGNDLLNEVENFDRLENLRVMIESFRSRLITWS